MKLLIVLLVAIGLIACSPAATPQPAAQLALPSLESQAPTQAVTDAPTATPETMAPLPTVPPSPTAAAIPSEEALVTAATTFFMVFAKGNPVRGFSYYSADYQSQCLLDSFVLDAYLTQALLFGDIADGEVEYEVTDITVEGSRHYVTGTFVIDGRPLSIAQSEDAVSFYWEWTDGKWWRSTDNANPCPPLEF